MLKLRLVCSLVHNIQYICKTHKNDEFLKTLSISFRQCYRDCIPEVNRHEVLHRFNSFTIGIGCGMLVILLTLNVCYTRFTNYSSSMQDHSIMEIRMAVAIMEEVDIHMEAVDIMEAAVDIMEAVADIMEVDIEEVVVKNKIVIL